MSCIMAPIYTPYDIEINPRILNKSKVHPSIIQKIRMGGYLEPLPKTPQRKCNKTITIDDSHHLYVVYNYDGDRKVDLREVRYIKK